eukprot:6573050-Lingulodinium_polyedra.AAC.1
MTRKERRRNLVKFGENGELLCAQPAWFQGRKESYRKLTEKKGREGRPRKERRRASSPTEI